jgi:DNA-directed RNA polymerase specialized sigma24 family protein
MKQEYTTRIMADRWITILRQKAEYEHNARKMGEVVASPDLDDVCNEMIAYFSGIINKLDWEKEFDVFWDNAKDKMIDPDGMNPFEDSELKLFIGQLLSSQRQQIIKEKIEGVKSWEHQEVCTIKEINPQTCGWCLAHNLSRNGLLDDILKELN